MKNLLIKISFCVLLLASTYGAANAEVASNAGSSTDRTAAGKLLKGTGKAAVIVVGTAAKVAWETTKFTAKYAAKPILLKAVPKITIFALNLAGKTAKTALPAAGKLSLAYLKTKLP